MRRLGTALSLLALLTVGCATIRVRTDYDPNAEFFAMRTFAWLEPPLRETASTDGGVDPFARNTLLDKRVRTAVEQELTARGYRKVEPERADFYLRYQVVLREKTVSQPTVVHAGVHHHPFSYSGYYGTYTYDEGTLLLDVIDPKTEQIAWRGWGQARTDDEYLDAEEVRSYVERILARFPPNPDDAPGT